MDLPPALLLDLDDTILDIAESANGCWQAISVEWAPTLGVSPERMCSAIVSARDWCWSDSERNRIGRLDLRRASRHEVETSPACGSSYGRPRPGS